MQNSKLLSVLKRRHRQTIPQIKFKTIFGFSSEDFIPLKVGKEEDRGCEGVVDLVTEGEKNRLQKNPLDLEPVYII